VVREKLTNPDLNKKYLLINSISVGLFTILVLYLTVLHNRTYFFKLQDLSLFLPTKMFFLKHISIPGGFLGYLGLFFTQFFYYPWLGSLILIFWLFVIQFLTIKAFNLHPKNISLALIPALLLLLTITQLGYYIYILYSDGYVFSNLFGIIIVLGTFWIYQRISRNNFRLLFSVLFITVFYHVSGFYSLLAVLLFVVFEIVTVNRNDWKYHLINITLALTFMAGIPFLFYRYFYITNRFPDVYFAVLPRLGYTGDFTLWLPYLVLFAFLIFSVLNFLPRAKPPGTHWLFNYIPACVFLLVMIGIYHFSYDDENFRTELAMERAIWKNDWDKVLALSQKVKGEPTRLIVMDTYLALRKLQLAGDKMFTYKDGNKQFNTRKPVLEMEVAGKMLFFQYGMENYCYRWCMEDMICSGMKIENLKYFVKSCLLNGELSLARKYNDVLQQTLFHKPWAKKYQELIENPEKIESDPKFKIIFPLIDPINKLYTEKRDMLEEYLTYSLASVNIGSAELLEIALQCNLEMKNSARFWPLFDFYLQTHSRIPVHYQEAALLFSNLEKNVDVSKINFDSKVISNFMRFINLVRQYEQLSRPELEPIFMNDFGKTYWYYYFFFEANFKGAINKFMSRKLIFFGFFISMLVSCGVQIPDNFRLSSKSVRIYPDYTNLTIPYNIAPLNFTIEESADEYVTRIYSKKGGSIEINGKDVLLKENQWKTLLSENKEDTLFFQIYLHQGDEWIKYPVIKNYIANEPIDSYVCYRLIEPSFATADELSIQQRDLTNFKEKTLYNNRLVMSDTRGGQCINCHSFQDYNRTGNMQLHVRGYLSGTLITKNNRLEKFNLKTDSTISAGVYPAWHPSLDIIAYSVNLIHQNFHTKDDQKVEVQDNKSGLILYDIEKNEVRKIVDARDELETFPYWAPDGKSLYFVAAHYIPKIADLAQDLALNYENIKYDLYKIAFNPPTLEFGKVGTVFKASAIGKSATFPRLSPNGKYLMFTMADFGNFHIWHKTSDLYLMNLETGETREIEEINSKDVESYHSWSSNGSWVIFSSRREDGAYTRLYITRFDGQGNFHKPFVLPQKEPQFNRQFFKSFNIPEFLIEPVDFSPHDFLKAVKRTSKRVVFAD